MKKLLFLLVLIVASVVSFSQSFVKVNNLTGEGLLVTVNGKSQYLPADKAINNKHSFIIYDKNVKLIIFSESTGKTIEAELPVENGEINILRSLIFPIVQETSQSLTSMNFVKKSNPKVIPKKVTGRFVKVFNLTSHTMHGMTREFRGLTFYPGGVEEEESGSKSYIVSEDLGIKYKPFEDYFLDKNNVRIEDSLLLYRVLNSSFSSAMHLVWLPFEDINFNLRYQGEASTNKNKDNKSIIDLLAVVQRKVTPNTSMIIITDDDLEKYSPRGEPVKRRIQNETEKTFILDLDGKKVTCSPKIGRKISLSENFYLPDGAYYLPMSIIYEGQMYEFYFLTIFDSKFDRYPKINGWDVSDLEMFNQKPLE